MPLVRIDVVEGRSEEELRALVDAVQGVTLDVFAAPDRDRYHVTHEHKPGQMIAEDTGLGFERNHPGHPAGTHRGSEKGSIRRARRAAPGEKPAALPRIRHGKQTRRRSTMTVAGSGDPDVTKGVRTLPGINGSHRK